MLMQSLHIASISKWPDMNRADPVGITTALDAGNVVKTTTCYMCACRCGIKVHVRGDEVRYIEGNPAHPINQAR